MMTDAKQQELLATLAQLDQFASSTALPRQWHAQWQAVYQQVVREVQAMLKADGAPSKTTKDA